jgi:hypothetical protein
MRGMSQAAPAQLEGLILGRYRALEPLGSGGSGSVWLARDESAERPVALKVVAREGKAGERAEREALAVARLRNRRCARVYAVERDDRHVYIAYEYVPGRTLRETIREGELTDRAAVEAGAQVLEALAHAHAKGIVHRDVKPANVLVEDGDEVSVRLLDFGLAQFEEAETLTAAGDVPGTLAYIAPERLNGQDASGAADVWAVGVILWEALAGYQPFATASPVETARRIGAGAPALARARPDLPRSLTAAVDRALAPDPRRRPQPKRLAAQLRASVEEAAARRSKRPAISRHVVLERAGHAGLAAVFAALAAGLLPFYPSSWTALLAVMAALAAFAGPRAGLCFALAVPVLPLGDISLALAVVYAAVALGWLCVFWRDARHGLLCTAGPLLAVAGGLALVPLIAERAEGAARRALQAAAAVLLAALVAGLRRTPLPLSGDPPPLGLGIAGSDSPVAVAGVLWRALAAQPVILTELLVLAAVTVALPHARRLGLWGIAGVGAAFLAVSLGAPPLVGAGRASALPLVLGAFGVCLALAMPRLRTTVARRPRLHGPEVSGPYNDAG